MPSFPGVVVDVDGESGVASTLPYLYRPPLIGNTWAQRRLANGELAEHAGQLICDRAPA